MKVLVILIAEDGSIGFGLTEIEAEPIVEVDAFDLCEWWDESGECQAEAVRPVCEWWFCEQHAQMHERNHIAQWN